MPCAEIKPGQAGVLLQLQDEQLCALLPEPGQHCYSDKAELRELV